MSEVSEVPSLGGNHDENGWERGRSDAVTTGDGQSVGTDRGLTRDDIFDVLSNRRRRFALHYLKQTDGQVELGALAERVAVWELEKPAGDLSATERKRLYTALQQSHLPYMDRAGVVVFDKQAGLVELVEKSSQFDVYLDVVQPKEIPWSQYYIGLAAIGATLVAGAWAGVYPVSLVPDVVWGAFLVALLTVSSVAHYVADRRNRVGGDANPPEVEWAEASRE